jgi:hypothetical protein
MAALDGSIKVPVVGEVKKKTAVIGGVAIAGVVVVAIIRKRNSASAAAATSATTGTAAATSDTSTDPAGNVGVIDPATGYVYGSPEDEQALESASGSGDVGVGYGSDTGDYSGIDPNTGIPYADETGYGGIGTTVGTTTPETRDQWIQAAESDLNAPNMTSVAANIFAGLPVSSADKDLFLQAVALEGAPPGGYPTPIKLTDTKGHPGTTSAKVKVPNVKNEHSADAQARLEAAGLKAHLSQQTPHGKVGVVISQTPAAGASVAKGSTVDLGIRIQK